MYVAGLAAAGTFVGGFWPLLRRRGAMYLAFALGGVLVGVAVTLGEAAGNSLEPPDWIIGVVVGAAMGCAFAYGFRKGPS